MRLGGKSRHQSGRFSPPNTISASSPFKVKCMHSLWNRDQNLKFSFLAVGYEALNYSVLGEPIFPSNCCHLGAIMQKWRVGRNVSLSQTWTPKYILNGVSHDAQSGACLFTFSSAECLAAHFWDYSIYKEKRRNTALQCRGNVSDLNSNCNSKAKLRTLEQAALSSLSKFWAFPSDT